MKTKVNTLKSIPYRKILTRTYGLITMIVLIVLTVIQSCKKDLYESANELNTLRYEGNDPFVLQIIGQLSQQSIKFKADRNIGKVRWDEYLKYSRLGDTISTMLVPIYDHTKTVDNYLKISLMKGAKVNSAQLINLQKDYVKSEINQAKVRTAYDIVALTKNGFKISFPFNSDSIKKTINLVGAIVKDNSNRLMVGKGHIIKKLNTSGENEPPICQNTITILYTHYPSSCSEGTVATNFMNRLPSELGLYEGMSVIELTNEGVVVTGTVGYMDVMAAVHATLDYISTPCGIEVDQVYNISQCNNTPVIPSQPNLPKNTELPCAAKVRVAAAAANPVISAYYTQVAARLSNSSYEWGVPIVVNSYNPTDFKNIPIFTSSMTDALSMPLTWNSTNGYTIGGIHSHPGGGSPDRHDIFAMVTQLYNLANAGTEAINFYRANASQTIVVDDNVNYEVTVKDWGKLVELYESCMLDPAAFDESITQLNSTYNTDMGGILAKFGDAINMFMTIDNRQEYIPISLNKALGTINEIPCN